MGLDVWKNVDIVYMENSVILFMGFVVMVVRWDIIKEDVKEVE